MSDDKKTSTVSDSKKIDLLERYNELTQKKIPWVKVKMLPFGMDSLIKEIVEFVGVMVLRIRALETAQEKAQAASGAEEPPKAP